MSRFVLILVAFLPLSLGGASTTNTNQAPFGIKWGHSKEPQTIEGFRYNYGTPKWGAVRYLAESDIYDFQAELVLYYTGQMLRSVVLILGPGGINNVNCTERYKEILSLLNKKYGHYLFQSTEVDSDMSELFYTRVCTPVSVGLKSVTTTWKTPQYQVEAILFGDEDTGEIFIEVDYMRSPRGLDRQDNRLYKML